MVGLMRGLAESQFTESKASTVEAGGRRSVRAGGPGASDLGVLAGAIARRHGHGDRRGPASTRFHGAILHLQRAAGNEAVRGLLGAGADRAVAPPIAHDMLGARGREVPV